MKKDLSLTAQRMGQIQMQYRELITAGTTFSIADFLNFDNFTLKEYCQTLNPHPQSETIIKIAQQYCEEHGIWIEQAKHYITCELFLYPDAEFDRLVSMVENNAIDYYLNDIIGRDLFGHLNADRQHEARELMKRMSSVDCNLLLPDNATSVEKANIEILRFMKNTSPFPWFEKFLHLYCYHIDVTHKDGNSDAQGYIPSINEYIELRCHTSGMHHIVMLIEYADGNFLNMDWCSDLGIDNYLQRVNFLTAAFGCLSNDLFSFEKEVIDNSTDANLLTVVALNNPMFTLTEVIVKSAKIVQEVLIELLDLINKIKKRVHDSSGIDELRTDSLNKYLKGIEKCLQASWLWQVYTKRYKRPASIFEETQLPGSVAQAV
ncbi:terpene synthase family protein [Chitinophaga sp. HK235]|uniref:terpene synthase family protein n=1 Tax=Chitinophaga sp. HK235 TaxID=2952571 RepID=UPI001BA82CD5|nr:terpene synthase family protein [Chitinophaga sp. HK235]